MYGQWLSNATVVYAFPSIALSLSLSLFSLEIMIIGTSQNDTVASFILWPEAVLIKWKA